MQTGHLCHRERANGGCQTQSRCLWRGCVGAGARRSLVNAAISLRPCQDLSRHFSSVRFVRGDGNCFYRALCFAHLESMHGDARALQRSLISIHPQPCWHSPWWLQLMTLDAPTLPVSCFCWLSGSRKQLSDPAVSFPRPDLTRLVSDVTWTRLVLFLCLHAAYGLFCTLYFVVFLNVFVWIPW